MTDCLIIGFNESNFEEYVKMLAAMGSDSGAYRNLRLSFIDLDDKPMHSMDVLNHFYFKDRPSRHKPFHNADFLWPVITYLGSYLARRDLSFKYVNLPQHDRQNLIDLLSHEEFLTIAITTTLYVSPHPIIELVSLIRQYNPTARIVVGGPYISNQPRMSDQLSMKHLFSYLGADIYVVSSEGEAALANTIQALKSDTRLEKVDNIAFRSGNSFVMTGRTVESNPLEENMVRYSLFNRDEIGEFVTLRTAKSGPFNCSFCGFPERAGKYKYLSVEKVEEELNAIREIGAVSTLTFIDDTFNVPKGRFKEILRMMIRNGYGFKWNSCYRSDDGDEETIELMGKAGCEGVFLGVESGSDEMLSRMNKSARRKDYMNAIPQLRDAGISTYASLIVGFPGETYRTVEETVDLLEEAKPDFFRAQLWYADPVTPIWNQRDEYGVRGSAFNWEHNTMDSRIACDLVDRMFLGVRNSTWLPQVGFEQWSTFYLQRKGMSLERIKGFLNCFNGVLKRQLLDDSPQAIDADMLERLERSCRFGAPNEADADRQQSVSAEGYITAEEFWVREFSSPASKPAIELWSNAGPCTSEDWDCVNCDIDQTAFEASSLPGMILSAYTVLLTTLTGAEDAVVLTAIGNSVAPLRMFPHPNLSVSELVSRTQAKIEVVAAHAPYARRILNDAFLLENRGGFRPAFNVAYVHCEAEKRTEMVHKVLQFGPEGAQDIGLLLCATRDEAGTLIELLFARNRMNRAVAESAAEYLTSILQAMSGDAEARIGEICVDRSSGGPAMVASDALEAFNLSSESTTRQRVRCAPSCQPSQLPH